MEIRGNASFLNNNQDFKTIKGLFDENCKLSSKNVISTTAPACWEGKYFKIEIEADNGTPVTFLCDVPNKPLESGTPESAWYVPEEQLDEILDTNICDLIKEEKFQRVYIDKDNDGNAELSFGDYNLWSDNRDIFIGNKVTVDENSNGVPEYEGAFNFVESKDKSDSLDIIIRHENLDENDDGVVDIYNEYNSDAGLVKQKKYDNNGVMNEYSEWYDNGQLAYREIDNNADGLMNIYESFNDSGILQSKLEYLYDENSKITMQYTGVDNNTDDRINNASGDYVEDENLIKEMYDNDGDGKWDQIAEHSWSEKWGAKIRESLYDENGDGEFETYGKLKIREHKNSTSKTYSYRPATIDGCIDNVKDFFKGLFN